PARAPSFPQQGQPDQVYHPNARDPATFRMRIGAPRPPHAPDRQANWWRARPDRAPAPANEPTSGSQRLARSRAPTRSVGPAPDAAPPSRLDIERQRHLG